MKGRLYIYALMFLGLAMRMVWGGPWMPDLMLITVVFTGMFRGGAEGCVAGLIGGLMRGSFSVGTFYADVVFFPLMGVASYFSGKMLYRYSGIVQMAVPFFMLAVLIAAHVCYIGISTGSDVGYPGTLLSSWRVLLMTALVSPVFFFVFKPLWGQPR